MGVPDHRARVVAAAPSMHVSWLASVLLVPAFAIGNAGVAVQAMGMTPPGCGEHENHGIDMRCADR